MPLLRSSHKARWCFPSVHFHPQRNPFACELCSIKCLRKCCVVPSPPHLRLWDLVSVWSISHVFLCKWQEPRKTMWGGFLSRDRNLFQIRLVRQCWNPEAHDSISLSTVRSVTVNTTENRSNRRIRAFSMMSFFFFSFQFRFLNDVLFCHRISALICQETILLEFGLSSPTPSEMPIYRGDWFPSKGSKLWWIWIKTRKPEGLCKFIYIA